MNRFIKIYLLSIAVLIAAVGCTKEDLTDIEKSDITSEPIIEVLPDGRLKVSASIAATEQTPIETRVANALSPDDIIYTGWCMIFGVDETLFNVSEVDGEQVVTYKEAVYDSEGKIIHAAGDKTDAGYGPDSPLLQKTKIVANTNGRFYMTFKETPNRVFLRIVANLSPQLDNDCDNVITQDDIDSGNTTAHIPATFGAFIQASVGLDGLYDFNYTGVTNIDYDYTTGEGTGDVTYNPENTNSPDPSIMQHAFPMSSYGYILKHGISPETIDELFNEQVKMIRTFSKIVVYTKETNGFTIENITLLNGANESRIRSTVLSSTGDVVEKLEVPSNLGGSVSFKSVDMLSSTESKPIYLYPNSGSKINNKGEKVDNPTYLIIKGTARGYDSPGYYKVALKAEYPLTYVDGEPVTFSDLTYDIFRDNFFRINLETVDKPGYPTFEDAASPKNPANNIGYSIVINGEDNRNEFMVNKGTYFVELETSRVFAKGYQEAEGVSGSINMSINPSVGHYSPNVYVYGEDGVTIESVSVDGTDVSTTKQLTDKINAIFIEAPDETQTETGEPQKVSINYSANATGKIGIRCGDMLKYIPVIYENEAVNVDGGKLSINDKDGNVLWDSFAYSDIYYAADNKTLKLKPNGKIAANNGYDALSLGARMFPTDGSGFTQLFVKQASDFIMWDNANTIETENIEVVYNSKGDIVEDQSFKKIYNSDGDLVVSEGVPTKPTDGKYSYTIKGDKEDVTLLLTDSIAIKAKVPDRYPFKDFGLNSSISVDEPFSFTIGDIGTNNGDPSLMSEVYFQLTNTAKETKKYCIKITQYAAPSSGIGDSGVDEDGYITPKPTDGKEYVNVYTTLDEGRFSWTDWDDTYPIADAGSTLETVKVYNCYYISSDNGIFTDDDGLEWGWKWEEVTDTDIIGTELSAAEQLKIVDATINVGHDVEYEESYHKDYKEYGTHAFPITVKNVSSAEGTYVGKEFSVASVFFVLYVRNKVGERCETKILIQCESKK